MIIIIAEMEGERGGGGKRFFKRKKTPKPNIFYVLHDEQYILWLRRLPQATGLEIGSLRRTPYVTYVLNDVYAILIIIITIIVVRVPAAAIVKSGT